MISATRTRACGVAMTFLVAVLLSACGGGGGGSSAIAPPTPTPVPQSLAITTQGPVDAASAVQFGNSSGSVSGLSYSWAFGDGGVSSEPAPSHSYAKAGDYEVVLTLSNSAGQSREARSKLSVLYTSNVQGLACSGANSTGWCWQQPRPTGNYGAIYFVNESTGWHVGAQGAIFKTTDKGKTWVRQVSGTQMSLNFVEFFDEKNGWVFGDSDTALRTTDGGASWVVSKLPGYGTPTSNMLVNRVVVSAQVAYVDRELQSWVTIDGGQTWRNIQPRFGPPANDGTLWYTSGNEVFHSTDYGQTYGKVLAATAETPRLPSSFVFNNGIAALLSRTSSGTDQRTRAWITKDHGQSWTSKDVGDARLANDPNASLLSVSADGAVLTSMDNFTLMASLDGGATWKAAGLPALPPGQDYTVSKIGFGGFVAATSPEIANPSMLSVDGGKTWTEMASRQWPSPSYYEGFKLRRDGSLEALDGESSKLSLDRGKTWASVYTGRRAVGAQTLNPWFFDARKGLVVDANGQLNDTKDGGQTWTARTSRFAAGSRMEFVSATAGWLLNGGPDAQGGGDQLLYKTTDAGLTWAASPSAQTLQDFHFHAADLAWARSSSGGWLLSQDGGQSWAALSVPAEARTLHCYSALHLVVAGRDGLISVSKDGGKTWKPSSSGTTGWLNRLRASDANTLWALSADKPLRSTDRGETWARIDMEGVYGPVDLQFADAKNGWAVGPFGSVWSTHDGGLTWRTQDSGAPKAQLQRIDVVDAKTLWISGSNGELLSTATGGD